MSRLAFGGQGGVDPYRYTFTPLPETEAEATDDIYVCECNGAASSNEVGVGLGLTGSALVLTQSGGVGSVGGIRRISRGTRMGFRAPDALYNAILSSATGFSVMFGLRNVFYKTSTHDSWMSFFAAAGSLSMRGTFDAGSFKWSHSVTGGLGNGVDVNGLISDGGDVYVVHSVEYTSGTHFTGLALGLPGVLNDFPACDILRLAPHGCDPFVYAAGNNEALLGFITYGGTGYTTQFDIASVTMAAWPCVRGRSIA